MDIEIRGVELDDNPCQWLAVYCSKDDQPRVVGNALIFIEKDSGCRKIIPLSHFREITLVPVRSK